MLLLKHTACQTAVQHLCVLRLLALAVAPAEAVGSPVVSALSAICRISAQHLCPAGQHQRHRNCCQQGFSSELSTMHACQACCVSECSAAAPVTRSPAPAPRGHRNCCRCRSIRLHCCMSVTTAAAVLSAALRCLMFARQCLTPALQSHQLSEVGMCCHRCIDFDRN